MLSRWYRLGTGWPESAGVVGKEKELKVTTEKVARRTMIETVNASGKIYPEIEVKSRVLIFPSEIIELKVEEGIA